MVHHAYNNGMTTHACIIDAVAAAFDVPLTSDDVLMQLCKNDGHGMQATFALHGIENVDRQAFQLRSQQLLQQNVHIKTFKVHCKRPGRNVLFHLDYAHA